MLVIIFSMVGPQDQPGEKVYRMSNIETVVIGGGCFWCLEAVYLNVKGVQHVTSGYAGDKSDNPTYDQVCSGRTGHAEVIKIDYDPSAITYEDLLRIFFAIHDPTTLNRQGNDVGTQYRSIIMYADDHQKDLAEKVIREITEEKLYDAPIVTELAPLAKFFPAEEYHQRYFERNPQAGYCQVMIAPKVAKFRNKFGKFLKQ
jgi:peptide-methionine (S)-S-oxide reductase